MQVSLGADNVDDEFRWTIFLQLWMTLLVSGNDRGKNEHTCKPTSYIVKRRSIRYIVQKEGSVGTPIIHGGLGSCQ